MGWEPNYPLERGLDKTYMWIEEQVDKKYKDKEIKK